MEKSESIKSIGTSLTMFHIKMEKIKKDATNPFYHSKYATLSNILEAIRFPLSESGLSFSQFPDGDCLCTILIHNESGEFIQSCYNIHPTKKDPQSIGSAITYARRYALSAILGINVDEDDDGNSSSQTEGKTATATTEKKEYVDDPNKQWLSENQYKSALERIIYGELEVFDKVKSEFKMKKEYYKGLYDAYLLAKNK